MLICDRCGQTSSVKMFQESIDRFNVNLQTVACSTSPVAMDLCERCRVQLWTLIKDFCAAQPLRS